MMQEASNRSGRRILLVEDDIDLRQALSDALSEQGHDVVTASDGAAGLEKMRAFDPHIVVLDLMMPTLDGWQFRLAQRQEPSLARTPVVVISASESPAALAVNADLYVRKPFDAATLIDAIEGVLNTHERAASLARVAQTERLAALGTLAAGLAHEINNPLTYVMFEIGRALRAIDDLDPDTDQDSVDELRSAMTTALHGAERIRSVTNAMRTFARPDESRPVLLDVRGPLEDALKLVAHELDQRARLSTDYDAPPFVRANEARLGQVFLNLLTNAVQAIPAGNPEDHEISIGARADGDGSLVVEISDTGVGIPEHIKHRVFEPFFSTKPVGQGTGLGLSISHSIIESYGGTLTVDSEPGQGTTFVVRLPAVGSDASEP